MADAQPRGLNGHFYHCHLLQDAAWGPSSFLKQPWTTDIMHYPSVGLVSSGPTLPRNLPHPVHLSLLSRTWSQDQACAREGAKNPYLVETIRVNGGVNKIEVCNRSGQGGWDAVANCQATGEKTHI